MNKTKKARRITDTDRLELLLRRLDHIPRICHIPVDIRGSYHLWTIALPTEENHITRGVLDAEIEDDL